MNNLYIGLISGTSVDGIDAALVDFSKQTPRLVASCGSPISEELATRIHALCADSSITADLLNNPDAEITQVDTLLGEAFAEAARSLINKAGLQTKDITAIGSHGQTVRHQPPTRNEPGFSLQIGNASRIAELTGINTISDFRSADMLAGGEGAPLAPAFHQAIVPADISSSVFLNLGGIANITSIFLGELICGFDTGPANTLMDSWIRRHKHMAYDADGKWASSGTANRPLLEKLLCDPYFTLAHPKSTGREYFHLEWLASSAGLLLDNLAAEDVQATLLELSAQTIANEILKLPNQPEVVFCCGGGSHNRALRASIDSKIGEDIRLTDTSELGIHPDWIEACLFAWLARKYQYAEGVDLRNVTGAREATILGKLTTAP